jgi:hypothetical protein
MIHWTREEIETLYYFFNKKDHKILCCKQPVSKIVIPMDEKDWIAWEASPVRCIAYFGPFISIVGYDYCKQLNSFSTSDFTVLIQKEIKNWLNQNQVKII